MQGMQTTFKRRGLEFPLEKHCIGTYIAYYLRKHAQHQAVAIDGGSTNFEVIRLICRDVEENRQTVSQVLTNNFAGICHVSDAALPDVGPIWRCTGGVLQRNWADFADGAEDMVHKIDIFIAVIGVNGFVDREFQTHADREHAVKKAMVDEAPRVIFPFHASKWGIRPGRGLFSLDDLIKKHVHLVTCYPIQEEKEDDEPFGERVQEFLRQVHAFVRSWPHKNIEIVVAVANENDVDFTPPQKVSIDDISNNEQKLEEVYFGINRANKSQSKDMIIRFDFRPLS